MRNPAGLMLAGFFYWAVPLFSSRVPHLHVPRKMRYHALRLQRIELTGL
ncbi:hypothetical protein HPTD01_2416 [Halomonas sp. TD01]|nr:hypothetical protein GME_02540 [Halomonas sp. TD01]CAH1043938.1 hypothetical protein HPTD01_2416 [Halomonas sp. TD01]